MATPSTSTPLQLGWQLLNFGNIAELANHVDEHQNIDAETCQAVRQALWHQISLNIKENLKLGKQRTLNLFKEIADHNETFGKEYATQIEEIRLEKNSQKIFDRIQTLSDALSKSDPELYDAVHPQIDQYAKKFETLIQQRRVAAALSILPIVQEEDHEGGKASIIPTVADIAEARTKSGGAGIKRLQEVKEADLKASGALFESVHDDLDDWRDRVASLFQHKSHMERRNALARHSSKKEELGLELSLVLHHIFMINRNAEYGYGVDTRQERIAEEEARADSLRKLIGEAGKDTLSEEFRPEEPKQRRHGRKKEGHDHEDEEEERIRLRPKMNRSRVDRKEKAPDPSSSTDPPKSKPPASTPTYSGGSSYSGSGSTSGNTDTSPASPAAPKSTGNEGNSAEAFLSGLLSAIGGLMCFNLLFPSKKPAPKSSEPKEKFAMAGDKDPKVEVGAINHSKHRAKSFVEQTSHSH